MNEEVVNNVELDDKECMILCNWCQTRFEYTEKAGQVRRRTTCPWCFEGLSVPRQRLRRINGGRVVAE